MLDVFSQAWCILLTSGAKGSMAPPKFCFFAKYLGLVIILLAFFKTNR